MNWKSLCTLLHCWTKKVERLKTYSREAKQAFCGLRRIWNTREIGRKTKVQLFKKKLRLASLDVRLLGLKLTKKEAKKLDTFLYKCIKRMLRIRWPQTISPTNPINYRCKKGKRRDPKIKMEPDWSYNEEGQRRALCYSIGVEA